MLIFLIFILVLVGVVFGWQLALGISVIMFGLILWASGQ